MARTAVVVDDHPVFRSLMRQLLEDCGFEVVGEADDVRGALLAAEEHQPELVLLDVQLPDGSGLDAARTMRSWASPPMIVLVSTSDYANAVTIGVADAFIAKDHLSRDALFAAIGGAP